LTAATVKQPVMRPVLIKEYACVDHPILSTDAWSEVDAGYPKAWDGVAAHLTCRLVCRSRDSCPVSGGNSTIAAGGWWTQTGVYRENVADWIDVVYAAVYMGTSPSYLTLVVKNGDYQTKVVNGRRVMLISEMITMAGRFGPKHGTEHRYRLHVIRGEQPCYECAKAMETGN